MLIITTVFCVNKDRSVDVVTQGGVEENDDELCAEDQRELLSIYQGKNRLLPIDWFE